MDNLISIDIPTYNLGETLVNLCIPSVLNQTYQNFEINIVGDGCSDDTVELMKRFNDPRIHFENLPVHKYYRHGIIGLDAANRALDMCKGDWSARLNDDETFTRYHLERLLTLALSKNYNFVYGIMHGIGAGHWGCGDMGHSATMYDFRVFGNLRYLETDDPGDCGIRERMRATGLLKYGFVNETITVPAPQSAAWNKRNKECYGINK